MPYLSRKITRKVRATALTAHIAAYPPKLRLTAGMRRHMLSLTSRPSSLVCTGCRQCRCGK